MLHYLWLEVQFFTQYYFTQAIDLYIGSTLERVTIHHALKWIKNSDRTLSKFITFIGSMKLFCVSIGIIIPCVMSPLSGNFVD